MCLFEVFLVNYGGDGFYAFLSSLSLKFDILSYNEWNVVIFVPNRRVHPWLCITYFVDFVVECGGTS